MKVLVTGAAGFIGRRLVPVLAAAGHDVVAVVRRPEQGSAIQGAQVVQADLADSAAARALPSADAVIHLAQANVPFPDAACELYAVNTVSTLALLDHARRCDASRFVLASSGSVYGFGERPFREGDHRAQVNLYAVTKIHAENLVRQYEPYLGTSVLRLFFPYGPTQTGRMIPALIGRVRDGVPVTLNGGGRPAMNPIYVDDIARAMIASLDRPGHDVLNVAGDEVVDVRGLAEAIGRVVGRDPVFEDGQPTADGDLVADVTRFREELRLGTLVGLAEGLAHTVAA